MTHSQWHTQWWQKCCIPRCRLLRNIQAICEENYNILYRHTQMKFICFEMKFCKYRHALSRDYTVKMSNFSKYFSRFSTIPITILMGLCETWLNGSKDHLQEYKGKRLLETPNGVGLGYALSDLGLGYALSDLNALGKYSKK